MALDRAVGQTQEGLMKVGGLVHRCEARQSGWGRRQGEGGGEVELEDRDALSAEQPECSGGILELHRVMAGVEVDPDPFAGGRVGRVECAEEIHRLASCAKQAERLGLEGEAHPSAGAVC
jgi:hypothetical protein